MRKFSKIGASAIALALSVVLASPVTASATYYDIDRTGTTTIDEDGDANHSITSTTYRNKITNETYTYDNNGNRSGDYSKATKGYQTGIVKKLLIGTDSYNDYDIALDYGEALEGSVKIKSGKDVITLKKVGEYETTDYPTWDSETEQYYFPNVDGSKQLLGKLDTEGAYEAAKKTRHAYYYRLFGKKPGKAKLEFKYKNKAGKKVTVKPVITVSDDARVFQSVSYAGKLLTYDLSKSGNNSKNLASQTTNKGGIGYTTKKSGKFKVKMGKNYKFVTAYVVTNTEYVNKPYNNTNSYSSSSGSNLSRRPTGGIDLNKDGDTLDTINGIDERNYNRKNVKIIKNNAKISLGKNPEKINSTYTYTYDEGKRSESSKQTYTSNMDNTEVIVVYQNKLTKNFSASHFTITLRTSK